MVLDHKRALPQKATNPRTVRATDPSTSGHQPQCNWAGRRLLFNLVSHFKLWQVGTSWCSRSQAGVPQVYLRGVGGRRLDFLRTTHVVLEDVVCCGNVWPRFVVFTFWCRLGPAGLRLVEGSFPVLEEVYVLVSLVAECCTGNFGDLVVICTFLVFDVSCLIECAVDSDCRCWETPGRFLHHDMGRFIGREWRISLHWLRPPQSHFPLFASRCSLQPQRGDSTPGRLFEHSRVSTRTVPFLTPCCLCELSLVATFITLASSVVCNTVSLVGFKHSSYLYAEATSLTWLNIVVSCLVVFVDGGWREEIMSHSGVAWVSITLSRMCRSLRNCSTSTWFLDAHVHQLGPISSLTETPFLFAPNVSNWHGSVVSSQGSLVNEAYVVKGTGTAMDFFPVQHGV